MRVLLLALASVLFAQQPARYHVKQAIPGAVYLDAGSAAGLTEGQTIVIKRRAPGAARMSEEVIGTAVIVSVATQSALCELRTTDSAPQAGDEAELAASDAEAVLRQRLTKTRSRYAQIIRFTDGDPLEEEVREYVQHPPLSEEGRVRGQVGFEVNVLADRSGGARSVSRQQGATVRLDWTRIEGTYWNLTGYWRGRMTSRGRGQETLTDLLSRTYHFGMFYNNPRSPNQFGFGRLLLPWAASLSTLDGGYAARRIRKGITTGIFAGTTPDPTQWNYDPSRHIAGAFTSFEAGSFERTRFTETVGLAFTRAHGQPERRFLFMESSLYAGSRFSLLHSMEADRRNPRLMNGVTGTQLSRSFLTLRAQPNSRITLDLNHNYFQGVPTFDNRLIGTGLLDRLLFEGVSGGARVDPWRHLTLSVNLGRSSRDGDSKAALNYSYSAGWSRLPWLGGRIDFRSNKFNSSFGRGQYQSVSWVREINSRLRSDIQVGQQDFTSALTAQSRARFVNGQLEWLFGRHYFFTGGWLSYRGQQQIYDQMYFTLGYRLD